MNILIVSLYHNIKISSVEDDEFDELYDHYEQGDTKLQLGHPNIKTTARKMGDQAMWDLFEVCITFILADTCMNTNKHRNSNTQYVKPVKIVVFRTIHPRLILGLPQQWYGHIVLKR